jgi:hypothetical protein
MLEEEIKKEEKEKEALVCGSQCKKCEEGSCLDCKDDMWFLTANDCIEDCFYPNSPRTKEFPNGDELWYCGRRILNILRNQRRRRRG